MGFFAALRMGKKMVKEMLNLKFCRKCRANLNNKVCRRMDKLGLSIKDLEDKKSLEFLKEVKEYEEKMFCKYCKGMINRFCERNGIKT